MPDNNTLEELRARKAKRQDAAAKDAEARELATLLLEEKLEAELGGPRGRAFQIIDIAGEPLVAVKPGPSVLVKQLRESKGNLDDLQRFVVPCLVQPDKTTFAEIVERHGLALVRVADALVDLFKGEADVEGKKY